MIVCEFSDGLSPKCRAILQAAAEVFLEVGFGAASMDAIAKRANVSKQTIYNHFVSKENLFGQIVRARCQQYISPHLFAQLPNHDPNAALLMLARVYWRLIMEPDSVALLRVVIAEAVRFPALAKAFYEAGPQAGHESLAAYFAQLHAQGVLHIPDPMLTTGHFLSLLCGKPHLQAKLGLYQPLSAEVLDYFLRETVAMFVRAYAPLPR